MRDTVYKVVITKERNDWLADIPQLQGVHTFAHSLSSLERNIREAIALAEDLPEGAEEEILLDWHFPPDFSELEEALALAVERRRIAQLRENLDRKTRGQIQKLSAAGWSRRDQATLLGLSYGRIAQLA